MDPLQVQSIILNQLEKLSNDENFHKKITREIENIDKFPDINEYQNIDEFQNSYIHEFQNLAKYIIELGKQGKLEQEDLLKLNTTVTELQSSGPKIEEKDLNSKLEVLTSIANKAFIIEDPSIEDPSIKGPSWGLGKTAKVATAFVTVLGTLMHATRSVFERMSKPRPGQARSDSTASAVPTTKHSGMSKEQFKTFHSLPIRTQEAATYEAVSSFSGKSGKEKVSHEAYDREIGKIAEQIKQNPWESRNVILELLSESKPEEQEKVIILFKNLLRVASQDSKSLDEIFEAITTTKHTNPPLLFELYKMPEVKEHLEKKLFSDSRYHRSSILPFLLSIKEKLSAEDLGKYGLEFAKKDSAPAPAGFSNKQVEAFLKQVDDFLKFILDSKAVSKKDRSKIYSLNFIGKIKGFPTKTRLTLQSFDIDKLQSSEILKIADWLSKETTTWSPVHDLVRNILDKILVKAEKEASPEIKSKVKECSAKYELEKAFILTNSKELAKEKQGLDDLMRIKETIPQPLLLETAKKASWLYTLDPSLRSKTGEFLDFCSKQLSVEDKRSLQESIAENKNIYEVKENIKLLSSKNLDTESKGLSNLLSMKEKIPQSTLLETGMSVAEMYFLNPSLHSKVDEFLNFCLSRIENKPDKDKLERKITSNKEEGNRRRDVTQLLEKFKDFEKMYQPEYQEFLSSLVDKPEATLVDVSDDLFEIYKGHGSFGWRHPLEECFKKMNSRFPKNKKFESIVKEIINWRKWLG